MREEFISKINDRMLNDRALATKIAIGCQQVAKSVCFIHYWSFNALWLHYNADLDDSKRPTMKQLMEQASAHNARNAKLIADLEMQK